MSDTTSGGPKTFVNRYPRLVESLFRWGATVAFLLGLAWWPSLSNGLSMALWMAALLLGTMWLAVFVTMMGRRVAGRLEWPVMGRGKWVSLALCLGLVISAGWTFWPFHAAFAVSRPALSRLADQVEAGTARGGPHWCGVMPIMHTERYPMGTPVLFVSHSTSGWVGFARNAQAGEHVEWVGSNNGVTQIDARWRVVDED